MSFVEELEKEFEEVHLQMKSVEHLLRKMDERERLLREYWKRKKLESQKLVKLHDSLELELNTMIMEETERRRWRTLFRKYLPLKWIILFILLFFITILSFSILFTIIYPVAEVEHYVWESNLRGLDFIKHRWIYIVKRLTEPKSSFA